MEKLKLLNRVKEIYSQNQNIIQYLKSLNSSGNNSTEDILISYDFQAGSYIEYYKKNTEIRTEYCSKLADIIDDLGTFESILEVGVGEATTLGNVLLHLKKQPKEKYGFDISWSRIKYARSFLRSLNIEDVTLFTGDLFSTPIKDNSVDVVYTSHSIEPNGGREKEALAELYRITKKYLVLLEPSYELGEDEARKRMLMHGYVTKLYSSAIELGYNVITHKLFGVSNNPMNPTGLMIIKKDESHIDTSGTLCCPITKTDIYKKNNAYYSESSLLAYPIIDEIPCLLPGNAIVATHFSDTV